MYKNYKNIKNSHKKKILLKNSHNKKKIMIKCKNIRKINLLWEILYTLKNTQFLPILLWVKTNNK